MATIIIQPDPTAGKDSFVYLGDPTGNYGTNTSLQIYRAAGVEKIRSLIQFDLSSIPAGSVIKSAVFAWYLWDIYLASLDATIYRIDQDWGELTVTWNNQPTYADTIGSYLAPAGVGWVTISITTAVQNWHKGIWANQGFIIRPTNVALSGASQFYSSDYLTDPSLRPKLTVNYIPSGRRQLLGVGR